jgi:hypothetical protein
MGGGRQGSCAEACVRVEGGGGMRQGRGGGGGVDGVGLSGV